MDEDGGVVGEDVVGVELVDGEVVHVGGAGDYLDGGDADVLVGGGGEFVAGGELACGGPGVAGGVPEGVFAGGVDGGGVAGAGLDGQVDEVFVVVDVGGGDGA